MPYLSTVAAFGFDDFNPPTLLPHYQRLGCVRSQFYRNPQNAPTPADARRIAADAGLPFDSMHGIFGPKYDPSSPDEAVRQFAIETYQAEGELALQLGGPVVVIHPAPNGPSVPAASGGTAISPEERHRREGPLMRSMEQLAAIGERQGVTYLIENVSPHAWIGHDTALLAAMVRQIDHANLKMCFDTGHAHMAGDAVSAAASCIDLTVCTHINDNAGKLDEHSIPGTGTCPWEELASVFAKLPPATSQMLELFISEAELAAQIEGGLGDRLKAWLALDQSPAPRPRNPRP